MKKNLLLLFSSLMLVIAANPLQAEESFPADYACTDRAYRVVWNFEDVPGISEPDTLLGPLSEEEGFSAGLGAECCFQENTTDELGFTVTTDVGSGRTGVVVDTSDGGSEGSSHGRLISTNLAEEGERFAYRVHITFADPGGTPEEADLGLVIMETLIGATPEGGEVIQCFGGGGAEGLTVVGTEDHGDGFITIAFELISEEGVDISACENVHLAFEDMTDGLIIDEIIIDVAYFEGATPPTGGGCVPGPVIFGDSIDLVEVTPAVPGTFTVVMNTEPNDGYAFGSGSALVVIDPNNTIPTQTSLTDYFLNTAAPGVPITLTFTMADWHLPQTVTVTAVDDAIIEPDVVCIESFGVAATVALTDPNENADLEGAFQKSTADLINIQDNDAGCVIVDASGLSVNELDPNDPANQATYTYVLSREPATDVVVTLTHEDEYVEFDPEMLTFTSSDWGTPQEVTVKAIQDEDLVDGGPGLVAAISASSNGESGDLTQFNPINDANIEVIQDECGQYPFNALDFNLDCFVNLLDFSSFTTGWGECTEPDPSNCPS